MEFTGSQIFENMRLYKIKNYKVLYDGKKFTCDCRGYKTHKQCKHLLQAQKQDLYGSAKALLQNQIEKAIAEFIVSVPECKEIIFQNGEVRILI